jgi:sporulation protein YlmC with PRC-barrel domain
VELMRDLLDNQVIDRRGQKIGKVDGVILSIGDGRAPRVAALEVGAVTFAHRLHHRLGQWLERMAQQRGLPLGRTRIPWGRVVHVGRDVRVALDAERTRVHALERWLRTRIIGRIPGAG